MINAYEELFSEAFQWKLKEIIRLLEEAYKNYFEYDEDGSCKSAEGAISIQMPAFFWDEDRDEMYERPVVSVYSYVLGPHRNHIFYDIDEALEAVKSWHKTEMEYNYSKEESYEY